MEGVPLNWGEQRYVIWSINACFSNFVGTKSWPGLKGYIMDQKFLERMNDFCLSVKMTNPDTAFCYCFWGQCWEKGPETSDWMNNIPPPLQGVDNLGHNLALIVLDFFFPTHWYMQREWRGGVINKSIVLNAGSLSLKGISCLIPWGIFHCWLTQRHPF